MRLKMVLVGLCSAGLFLAPASAQKKKDKSADQGETVAKPLTERQKKKNEDKLRKELETPYRKWLNEDVAYIITDEERSAFKRLQTDAKIPHIGWAQVRWSERAPIATTDPGDASTYYFLHSYGVEPADRSACWGAAEHGVPFCAIAGQDNVMGVQFHPEKSSRSGLALLQRWLNHVDPGVAA